MQVHDILHRAGEQKKENQKFLKMLKGKHHRKLDDVVHDAHEAVFESFDCLTCANCCKTTSPIFYAKDIERIAKFLRIKAREFEQTYLRVDEDGDWVLKQSPCFFLDDDNTCRIYDVRPNACREYPHTDRANFYQITELTYRNTLVCPAVNLILDRVKQNLGA